MGLFSAADSAKINQIAAKSQEEAQKVTAVNTRSMNDELNQMSKNVEKYFSDSKAILITSKQQLHEYVDKCIEVGYAGIDTETTGLDRIKDYIVGASLYTPGEPECYIPMKHLVPLFDTPYKDQLSYEEVGEELQRVVDNHVKLILANVDFDAAMIYKDLKVDILPAFYYDVITAWRCLKENEKDNTLKGLYAKYVMKGNIDPKKFTDFFSPKLFVYCKPKVAALYAANDAKITYELFIWQLPYVTKSHDKCRKHHLEKIADLIWNIEFPIAIVCAHLHRRGVYLDDTIATRLHDRYTSILHEDEKRLASEVQELINTKDIEFNNSRPFRQGTDFNPNSNPHVKYLVNHLLGSSANSTGKDILKEINHPATKAVLDVRGDVKLIGTYVDKLPRVTAKDHRIHASFKAIGADTGRMCIAEGSYVNTVEGHKKIENIVPGDTVFSYDIEHDEVVQSNVVNVWKTGENEECVTIKYIRSNDNKCPHWLHCTPEHLIYIKDQGWKEARNLEKGDIVIYVLITGSTYDPEAGFSHVERREYLIESVTADAEKHDVYDIEVEGYHNYFVANMLVHNSSESPNMQNIPSHSKDIRHMFRATPKMTELVEVTTNTITLHNIDSVPTTDGLVKVKDLKEGQIIIMKDGKQEVQCEIISIKSEASTSIVTFKKEGD